MVAGGWALTEMRAQPPAVTAPPIETTAGEAVTPAESTLAMLDWLVGSWSFEPSCATESVLYAGTLHTTTLARAAASTSTTS